MGVNFTRLKARKIKIEDLKNKTVVIDISGVIYQFLSTVVVDGEPLKDSSGNIKSHLLGLLNRTVRFLELGITPVYVFDGPNNPLKKYGALDELPTQVTVDAKRLLDCLGVAWTEAEHEAEALCAHICNERDYFAVVSKDSDTLLFGAKKVILNLPTDGIIELIDLKENLSGLGVNLTQLVDVGILIGTDYNKHVVSEEEAFKLVKDRTMHTIKLDFDINKVRNNYLHPKVDYKLVEHKLNTKRLYDFLVTEREFSDERLNNIIQRLNKIK